MTEVSIVICYRPGTKDILQSCLRSLFCHTKIPFKLMIVIANLDGKQVFDVSKGAREVVSLIDEGYDISNVFFVTIPSSSASRIHGAMLDAVIPKFIDTDYVLTLDSDAMPVADNWLSELLGLVKSGFGSAGILFPWSFLEKDLPANSIEYRVRSQLCNKRCHVACQLFPVSLLRELSVGFNDGDDTGLAINNEIHERGLEFGGFHLTRCPNSADSSFDVEFNRDTCLIFGDKVFHQWGHSRIEGGNDDAVFDMNFGWARSLVTAYDGAEFLLDDENSYRYCFDREEEVNKENMQRLFGMFSQKMKG